MKTFYLTANSPGEISGFLVPVVAAIRRHFSAVRVMVILLPCTFATGREEAVAREVCGVDGVIPARQFPSLLLRGLPYKADCLLHLGGDLLYAGLLARRWRIPTWAFQWAQKKWDCLFRGYFVKTPFDRERLIGQGIAAERIHVVGELLVDAVRTALNEIDPQSASTAAEGVPDAPHIVFMPGSRDVEVMILTPFFLEVAEHVLAVMPRAQFSLLVSPYTQWGRVRRMLEGAVDPRAGGISGRLVRNDGRWRLVSAAGTVLHLETESPLRALASAHFAVSIPGTKTGEAAALGCPMLSLIPVNRLDLVPWHGLLGLLDWLPFVGRMLKRLILSTMVDRYVGRVYSQPNLLAQRSVVPELVGFLTPRMVADKVLEVFGRTPQGRPPVTLRGRVDGPLGPYSNNGAVESGWMRIRDDLVALYASHAGAAERAVRVVAAALDGVKEEDLPQPRPATVA